MNQKSEFLLYSASNEDVKIEVLLEDQTIWLTIDKIAKLLETSKQNINYHFQNIFKENEIDKNSTVKEISITQKEENKKNSKELEFYNLDAIIAVGCRINSHKATQFRIWAIKILKEYRIKNNQKQTPHSPMSVFD